VRDATALLWAYDTQLRDVVEVPSADSWERHGPLLWATYRGRRGFVSYAPFETSPHELERLVVDTIENYRRDPAITEFEWKTRGHDRLPGLDELLVGHGLVADETESVMVGRAEKLVTDVTLPTGVTIRRIQAPDEIRAMCAMLEIAFEESMVGHADELIHRQSLGKDDIEFWVAEADGQMVSAGRLEPVDGTDFAGIWGGGTLHEWRGKGIYRVLTGERARSALRRGKTLINSDSTEYSRPILARSGLVKVTTTTPYHWHRQS